MFSGISAIRSMAALMLAAAACSKASTSQDGTAPAPAGAPTRSSTTVLVAKDIQGTSMANLYDAIQALRPEWFRRQGATPIVNSKDYGVNVYVDNQRAGGVEILRQTNVTNASFVRYYSASEAQMRFGNGNTNGVIQVVTTSGKP